MNWSVKLESEFQQWFKGQTEGLQSDVLAHIEQLQALGLARLEQALCRYFVWEQAAI